jgi:putative ABC transport system permease protein
LRRVTLRGLVARRGRSALTALSVLVGVAMIAGTLAFSDAVRSAFHELFTAASNGADVVVSERQSAGATVGSGTGIPRSVVARLRRTPGVGRLAGEVTGVATVRGKDGRVLRQGSLTTVGLSYMGKPFQNLRILTGRPPLQDGEVVLDDATARQGGYHLGDRVPVSTAAPERRFALVGIARFGANGRSGGIASPFAAFDLGTAEQLYDRQGRVDVLSLQAAAGARPAELVRRLNAELPRSLVARTAADQVDANARQVGSRLSVLTTGLIAFAFVSVLVGGFVIFNTFSITVAQRTRELALLRIVGAGRRQVLGSVLGEALVIGLVAAALGLVAGLGAAQGMRGLFSVLGFDLPTGSIALSGRTVLVSLAVGIGTTLVAALLPALRATRVLPLEALRASAPSREGRRVRRSALLVAAGLGATGVAGLLYGSHATDAGADQRLVVSAGGAILLVIGLAFLMPPTIRPAVRLLGAPFARRHRLTGRLARENAARNPGRTAASASALMVGLALVLFVTIFASGLRHSSAAIIDKTFGGDFALVNQDGFSPIPAAAARVGALVGGVQTVSSLNTDDATVGPLHDVPVTGLDPSTISDVYRFDWIHGSGRTLRRLGLRDAVVERDTARKAHLHVGDHVRLATAGGVARTVTVRGIYLDNALLDGVAVPSALHDQLFSGQDVTTVLVKLQPGASRSVAAADLRDALRTFPDVRARSQQGLKDELGHRVDRVLALFSALLGMSVLVALLGILATLSLSVYERTQELGLVRVVGMPRADVRRMVRDESVITAALGAVLGVALGLFLAWAATLALSDEGLVFAVPWGAVLGCVAFALVAGALAAVLPANRAARLDPLEALGRA